MTCKNPEISDQILAWVDGALSPEEERRFADHVEGCDDCKRDAETLRAVTAQVQRAYRVQRRTPLAGHCPPTEELVDFAAATTPPNRAQALQAHLETCPRCSEDVEILRELDEAPAETEREAAPAMPAALRDAFRAASPTPVPAAAAPPPAVRVSTPRPGGAGWGMRRVLAAVATLTVLVGMTSLFVFRPDFFGAHQPGSDVVPHTQPAAAPVALGSSTPQPAEQHPAEKQPASRPELEGDAAPSSAPAPAGTGTPGTRLKAPAMASGTGGAAPASSVAPAVAAPVSPRPRPSDGVIAAPADEAPAAPPKKPASAPPAVVRSAPPAAPVVPAPTSVKAADAAPPAAKAAAKAPAAPPPAPPVVLAPTSRPMPVIPAAQPAPVIVRKTETRSVSPPPAREEAPAPVFAKAAPAGRPVQAEKDAASGVRTESKGGELSQNADVRTTRPSGSLARTSTSNVVVPPKPQSEAARRDGERDRYTQNADDYSRGGVEPQAPAAAPAQSTPTLSAGAPRTSGYANAPAPGGDMRGPSASTYASFVAYRARQTLSQLLGSHDFTVRVRVEPADAGGAAQVRRIRIDVVVGSSAASLSAATVRRELIRAVPLDPQRGDEVVVQGQ